MNLHILTGRPTREPEIVYYDPNDNNNFLTKFNFAVKKDHPKGENTADFFNCVAYGRVAKLVEKYVRQGIKIMITGRMENNNYEKDGMKVFGYNFIIEKVEFLEKKENEAPIQEDENGFMQVSEEVEKEMEAVFGK